MGKNHLLENGICKKFDIEGIKYCFNITPLAAPRMTKSDKWAKRECVNRYFAFRNELYALAYNEKYKLENIVNIIFVMPYPASWSEKKKLENYLTPVIVKPDIDNLIKSFLDALKPKDQEVWRISAMKIYGETGCILIF